MMQKKTNMPQKVRIKHQESSCVKKVHPKSSSLLVRIVKLIIREKTSTLFNTQWKWNSGEKKKRLKMFVCRSPLHQASFCLCVPHLHGKHLIKHVHQHPTIATKQGMWQLNYLSNPSKLKLINLENYHPK